jgi:N-acetylated-alpha-linked acidic dipeptidase
MAILACFPNIKAQEKLIGGFGKEASEAQFQLESQFDKQLNNVSIGQNIKELSAHPHHLGSPGGKAVAEAILGKFKQYGWNAKIETYHVLFPTPKTRILELTSPTVYKALLEEPALKEDATSDQQGMLPTYNAWGADGDVTAGLVYVNYGLPDDYDQLNRLNIDVKGKIVIARYGHSWRGIKPKIAQEHGAIGCIIYSDPKDDGFYQGDVYPKGSFRNEFGVQRGSVMDMVIYPGDPLTPGIGATEKAQRLDRNDASTILKIPVLPISYHDALAFLKVLDGPVVPDNWRGALPITYHVGSGTAVVRLKVESNWDIVPAYDVIATIRGSEFPDQWVIRGNHHDAWVFGAGDPVSGQAALLEEAKAIGTLCKNGWKPKRTLVYCAWDGEEPALLGSTEWAEDHAAELQRKAVAYINTDGNGRGFFDVGGSQALETFVTEITKEVIDPQENVSIYERQKALEATSAGSAKKRKEILSKPEFPVSALGSGSDYTAFLQHLGIPTLNMGFGGEDNGGEYHSIYDSYDNYSRFMDPDFHYGVTLAQTAGRTVLRLANAEVLPFDFRILQKTIGNYLEEVTKYAEELKETTEMDNLLIKNKYYLLASDPLKQLKVPEVKSDVPVIDFSELKTTLAFLSVSANLLSDVIAKKGTSIPNLKELNEHLYTAEQSLLIPEGLPKRPWFRHAIYAPGFYTGYGVKTLPGITEAIEQRNWQEVKEQIARTAKSIHEFTIFLDKTIELVK